MGFLEHGVQFDDQGDRKGGGGWRANFICLNFNIFYRRTLT
jgi:hypothetical protein